MIEDPLQIGRLRTAFLGNQISASELIERVLTRIAKWDDPALWITRTCDASLTRRAKRGGPAPWISPTFHASLRQRPGKLDPGAASHSDLIKPLPLFRIPF